MTTHRKLAAILSADAAGYSRLMADDEAATLRSLNDTRSLFRERIQTHGGRLIDTAGDSILAEFPSAVEAVDCAVESSTSSPSATASLPSTAACSSASASILGMSSNRRTAPSTAKGST